MLHDSEQDDAAPKLLAGEMEGIVRGEGGSLEMQHTTILRQVQASW